jgi:hypothetical protein
MKVHKGIDADGASPSQERQASWIPLQTRKRKTFISQRASPLFAIPSPSSPHFPSILTSDVKTMNSSTCNYPSNPSAGSFSRPTSYSFSTPSFLPLSFPSPFPSLVNNYASLGASGSTPPEWSTNRSQYTNPNPNPRVRYRDVTLTPQLALMPMQRPPFESTDRLAGYANQQSHWCPVWPEGMVSEDEFGTRVRGLT